MKVFITGATGFIGTKVVNELISAGHEVLGLARSDASEAKLKDFGPKVSTIRGDLTSLDALKKGAKESDATLHLGFIHDFGNYEEASQTDRSAAFTILDAIEGTKKPFVYTTGTLNLSGKLAFETDLVPLGSGTRADTERLVLDYKDKGTNVNVVRLAPTVHGEGDQGFVPGLIGTARTKGFSGYVEEGLNSWPAVHADDAAKLYVLVLEKGQAGHVYHGTAESAVKTKDIAIAIGKTLNIPVKSVSKEKAVEHFGYLGIFFAYDNKVSSEATRKELGWEPSHATILEDIVTDYYSKSFTKF